MSGEHCDHRRNRLIRGARKEASALFVWSELGSCFGTDTLGCGLMMTAKGKIIDLTDWQHLLSAELTNVGVLLLRSVLEPDVLEDHTDVFFPQCVQLPDDLATRATLAEPDPCPTALLFAQNTRHEMHRPIS